MSTSHFSRFVLLIVLTATVATSVACGWENYEPRGELGSDAQIPAPAPTQYPAPSPRDPTVATSTAPPAPSANDLEVDQRPDWLIPYSQPDPNVMLVVDRSGSMSDDVCEDPQCGSKWNSLVSLGPYLKEVKESARLGLALYPTSEAACGSAGAIRVPVSDDDDVDEQILQAVYTSAPGGRTPTAAALDEVREHGGLSDPDRDNVIILLTDGLPGCACTEDGKEEECERAASVESVARLADDGVKVFIIGFGVTADANATLGAMAQAAEPAFFVDEEFSTAPGYFRVDSVEQLVARLYTVSLQTMPCSFDLERPVEPNALVVSLDQEEVLACEGECDAGYSYDESTGSVAFHGETCAHLRNGAPHELWFGDRDLM